MKSWLIVSLLTVELGGTFGVASAEAVVVSSGEIEVTLSVEVGGNPVGVVAHFIDPGDDQETVTLGHQGAGIYGGTALVERADLIVVFEAIGAGAVSVLARPVTLTELGVDPALLLDEVGTSAGGDVELRLDATTERWGWAALGLTAAALSLLAWWALADYPKRTRSAMPEPVDEDQ
ncbi:MAG: hypothetical protein P1T08_06890 [Acidimicrobiia bacterium]|nr:hypothetical protein [Acidimicrobiia bacterium]